MSELLQQSESNLNTETLHTRNEILQQPDLWPTTVQIVLSAAVQLQLPDHFRAARILLTGAGTSAYAASSIAPAWPGAVAVPTTELLVDAQRYLDGVDVVISLARSGDSPESVAVVEQIRGQRKDILQFAIVCNQDGALSRSALDGLIVLDPRTNDLSLAMTSAFSNLALAGLVLARPDRVEAGVRAISEGARTMIPRIDGICERVAAHVNDRVVVLSSSPMHGWAREAGLKILELTAGYFPVLSETYLGLRHGPMSFVKRDTFVLCLLSSDPLRRQYEIDLIQELRSKGIGYLAGIGVPTDFEGLFDEIIPAIAPFVPDDLRTPYEIVAPQLLAYYLSRRLGLNPDNPSPDGIVNRVVQGVRIHSTVS